MESTSRTVGPLPNEQLREERQRRGWSRAYIAEQIGVADPKTIGRWECGRAFPSAYFLQRLCTLFQMSADELGLWQKEHDRAENESPSQVFSPPTRRARALVSPLYDPALPLALPDGLVGREKLLRALKLYLCSGRSLAATTLSGLPGVGKTALALELAHDAALRHYFHAGVLWVSLGPEPDIVAELQRWGRLLGIEEHELAREEGQKDWARAIHAHLATRKMLLIIDDAWTCQDALAFKLGGPECAYLLTTRLPTVALYFADTDVCPVGELGVEKSLTLLARFVPALVAQAGADLRELVSLVGGLPLALQLMGKHLQAQMYGGQPRRWRAALEHLKFMETRLQLALPRAPQERQMGLPADAPLSLQTAINLSYRRLNPLAQQALLDLATFLPTPGNFFEEAALALPGVSPSLLDSLLDSGLLASAGLGRYTLHQTIVDFARFQDQSQKRSAIDARKRDSECLTR